MPDFQDWFAFAQSHSPIAAVEAPITDYDDVLHQFLEWSQQLHPQLPIAVPVYYWNLGLTHFMQVRCDGAVLQLKPEDTLEATDDLFEQLLREQPIGIFLIEGIFREGALDDRHYYRILTAYRQLKWAATPHYWVLLDDYIELPDALIPLVPIFKRSLPDYAAIRGTIAWVGERFPDASLDALVRACQGLPQGEIRLSLERQLPTSHSIAQLAEQIVRYKTAKLAQQGVEFIAEPDVPNAGGLDLLDKRLSQINALLSPIARSTYNLRCPRGMILWGPPGTGKSLSAKLAAKKMGVPLLAVDWVGISSDHDLRSLLAMAEAMAPCVLYFDDFEKGVSLDATHDGGAGRRRTGKLLTWMQEHQSQVFVIATVNRLGMMPPELIRRFEEEIYFVDLPHDGARYDIFNLHLAKYFPSFRGVRSLVDSPWSEQQWRSLLTVYRLCTPAEIGNAVRRVAQDVYYRLHQEGRIGEPLAIAYEQLLDQRDAFTPALEREEGAILEIRNKATFAKPASGPDTSVFARAYGELFEFIPDHATTLSESE
jgi:hypothetical protein